MTGGATGSGGSTAKGGETGGPTGGSTVTQSGGASGAGGKTGAGGSAGSSGSVVGGSTGSGGSGIDGGAGNGGAAKPSAGCGKTDGAKTITAGGSSVDKGLPTSTKLKIKDREYIIDIPADYDPSHPYRLIFSWHQAYGSDVGNANGQYPANNGPNFDAKNYAYFGLQRESTNAKQPAIFVAPQGIGNFPWDYTRDVTLFDDLLALVTQNLCIDESRVFTTGFSFGAMMSYALSIGRATKLRAAVAMAAANYNFTQPTNEHVPIAYMGTTGLNDCTCPWVNDGSCSSGSSSGNSASKQGGKYCNLQHAEDNGCTIPTSITTTKAGSKSYVCYDFEGCKPGYPVKTCTFDGNHTPSVVDDGTNGGDDGAKAFIPPLAWKFMAQF
jgi:polyhydroxybutyrate depolymerase